MRCFYVIPTAMLFLLISSCESSSASQPAAGASALLGDARDVASAPPEQSNSTPMGSHSVGTLAAASVPPAHDPDVPRIYSKRRHVWIYYKPSASNGWTGFLGLGSSVPLRSTESRSGDGCVEFFPVEPRGWVCLNEKTTLDPNDAEYQAIKKFAPKLNDPFPHNYGESRGLPRYTYVPTAKQQLRREYKLKEHLEAVDQVRSGKLKGEAIPKALRGVDLSLAGSGVPKELALFPHGIQESRNRLKPLSTVAWSHQFDAAGRTWLVTADLALVPKDKVRPYKRSWFGGVQLDAQTKLPIAFVRYEPREKHILADSRVRTTGEKWPRLTILPIEDGDPLEFDGKKYYRIKGGKELIAKEDATVARLSSTTPWGALVDGVAPDKEKGALQRVPAPQGGRRTWVEVSVLGGWMVAYEDTRAVFATLIAPGRGGVPARGIPAIDTASTPVGTFRVDGKFYTATMANPAFVHSDVPFSQNFSGPHVLHQAYWHDGWGEKRSGGCINLSPKDALWFFRWSEPTMPEGWFGLRSDQQAGPATVVWVHR